MAAPFSFGVQFRQHLDPRLIRLCVAHGRCVAAGVEDYTDAYNAIMHYAQRYGAIHLNKGNLDELMDWLGTTLLGAVVEAEAGGWGEWVERNHVGPGARV